MTNFDLIEILNPKRGSAVRRGWEGFFPYYAGYPEEFVTAALKSLNLPANSLVCDPWNGSGTTTSACKTLGLPSWGVDLNPVMVIVAKARLLPPTEADSLSPLSGEILMAAKQLKSAIPEDEPLRAWFDAGTARSIRHLETSIRRHLVGGLAASGSENRLLHMSTLAAAFYVALFSTCRHYMGGFKTANPTWLRDGRRTELRVAASRDEIHEHFWRNVASMAQALCANRSDVMKNFCPSVLELADTSTFPFAPESVDVIVTSPPYCTRLDYVAATRCEIALVEPWLKVSAGDLSSKMTGTVRVPKQAPAITPDWGRSCSAFLEKVKNHPSKASSGYYLKNHLDYFDKLYRSLENISSALKPGSPAIFVAQDSFYKEIHNPLPDVISEMGRALGLTERRRECFSVHRSMSSVNSRSRPYRGHKVPVEAVICLQKEA